MPIYLTNVSTKLISEIIFVVLFSFHLISGLHLLYLLECVVRQLLFRLLLLVFRTPLSVNLKPVDTRNEFDLL
jgi:hypothetical protein